MKFFRSAEIDVMERNKNNKTKDTLLTSLVAARTGGGPRVLPRSEREDARAGGGDINIDVVSCLTAGGQEPSLHHPLPVPVVQTVVTQSWLREDQLEVACVWVAEDSVTK